MSFRNVLRWCAVGVFCMGGAISAEQALNPNNQWMLENYPDSVRMPNEIWFQAWPSSLTVPYDISTIYLTFTEKTATFQEAVDSLVMDGQMIAEPTEAVLGSITIDPALTAALNDCRVGVLYRLIPGADGPHEVMPYVNPHIHDFTTYYGGVISEIPVDTAMTRLRQVLPEEAVFYAAILHADSDPGTPPDCQWVNEEYYDQQWNLRADSGINVYPAWDILCGAQLPLIGVCDAGYGTRPDWHPDIQYNIHPMSEPETGELYVFHGLSVAGIIGANVNNFADRPRAAKTADVIHGMGIAGVAYGAPMVLTAYRNQTGYLADLYYLIHTVPDVRAINCSWSTDYPNQALADLVEEAYYDKGIVIVASAGNCDTWHPCHRDCWPAAYPEVIAVGSPNMEADRRADFSNYGDFLNCVAPGDGVTTLALFTGKPPQPVLYASDQGTSFSAAHVTGTAALLMAGRPDLPGATIAQLVMETCKPLDMAHPEWNEETGYGMIDAGIALGTAMPMSCDSIPGDANSDCHVNYGDVLFLIDYLNGGPAPLVPNNADANGDCVITVGDAVWIGHYVLGTGPAPLPGCVTPPPGQSGDGVDLISELHNYPNPFNPATTISFHLASPADVRLTVYNVLGQQVVELIKGNLPAGPVQATWTGNDAKGGPVASGVYLYKLEVNEVSITRKMVLMK